MPRVLFAKATPQGVAAASTAQPFNGKEVQLKLETTGAAVQTAKRVLVSAPTTPTYNGRTPLIVTPSSSGGAGSVGKQATFTIIKQDGTTATATPASLPPNTRCVRYSHSGTVQWIQ